MQAEVPKSAHPTSLQEMFNVWDKNRVNSPRNISEEVRIEELEGVIASGLNPADSALNLDISTRTRNRNLAGSIYAATENEAEPHFFCSWLTTYVSPKHKERGDSFDGMEVYVASGKDCLYNLRYGELDLPEFFRDWTGQGFQARNEYIFDQETDIWIRVDEIMETEIPRFFERVAPVIGVGKQPIRVRSITEFDYERLSMISESIKSGLLKPLRLWTN